MQTILNFTLYKGKYKRLLFTVIDEDTKLALDISTASFDFTIKRSTGNSDAEALVAKKTGSGITIVDGPNGIGQIDIIPDDTAATPMVDQLGVWDLQIVRSGYPEIIAHGNCQLLIPVTRAAI